MDYKTAISLIGLPVERLTSGRRETVINVTDERDGGHNVLLGGGQVIPLENFDELWKAVENDHPE